MACGEERTACPQRKVAVRALTHVSERCIPRMIRRAWGRAAEALSKGCASSSGAGPTKMAIKRSRLKRRAEGGGRLSDLGELGGRIILKYTRPGSRFVRQIPASPRRLPPPSVFRRGERPCGSCESRVWWLTRVGLGQVGEVGGAAPTTGPGLQWFGRPQRLRSAALHHPLGNAHPPGGLSEPQSAEIVSRKFYQSRSGRRGCPVPQI